MTALLLAGGMGTRIRHLHPDLPKPMIPVAGKPFLEWGIRYWAAQGLSDFVISLGHLAQAAESYFATRAGDGLTIRTIVEPGALGTGGAVVFASPHLADPFAVANADSIVFADTSEAQRWICEPGTDAVVLGVRVPDTSRYGSLAIENGALRGFREKQPGAGAGVINAGIYFFRRHTLDAFPQKSPLSMETDVFPALLATGRHIRVSTVDAPFLDIGTPESLTQAEAFIQTNFQTRANFGQPS